MMAPIYELPLSTEVSKDVRDCQASDHAGLLQHEREGHLAVAPTRCRVAKASRLSWGTSRARPPGGDGPDVPYQPFLLLGVRSRQGAPTHPPQASAPPGPDLPGPAAPRGARSSCLPALPRSRGLSLARSAGAAVAAPLLRALEGRWQGRRR